MDWVRFAYNFAVLFLCGMIAWAVIAPFPKRRGAFGVAFGLTFLLVGGGLRAIVYPHIRAWETRRYWAPLLAELEKSDPGVTERFDQAVTAAWRGIRTWEMRAAELRKVGAEYLDEPVSMRIAEASDESALAYGRAVAETIHEVARQGPEACFAFLFVPGSQVNAATSFSESSIRKLMNAGVAVLKSSREDPQPPPDEGTVAVSLAAALDEFSSIHPNEARVLTEPARLGLNRGLSCRAMMLLFDEFLARGDVDVVRWVLSQPSPGAAIARGSRGI